MNPLSKLLYFGNVAGNLGGFCVFLGIVFALVAAVTFIVHNVQTEEIISALKYNMDDDKAKKCCKRGLVPLWSGFFLFFSVVVWVLAAFTPSSDTVYAIAASEMGAKALQSPLVGKAELALGKWLDDKIAAPAPSTEDRQK